MVAQSSKTGFHISDASMAYSVSAYLVIISSKAPFNPLVLRAFSKHRAESPGAADNVEISK